MMQLLSSAEDEACTINPFIFQQVCGAIFTGNEDDPINGETQEGAHEFMMKLLEQLKAEHPKLDTDQILAAQFAEQQVCECGARKTFTEETSSFNIPEDFQRTRVHFSTMLDYYLQDDSKFEGYCCEKCGRSGKWSTKGCWEGKRMIKEPDYILAHVPRGHIASTGHKAGEVKLTTKIVPPLKKISIPAADGSQVQYHMVAMIKHKGRK
jgi:uncharacterized UBP type Zn finger protein